MSSGLKRLVVRNFRSLANVDVETGPVNVLFGPNGCGKSSLLDAIWFVHDCVDRGVDFASSERSHGIGMLWDGAEEGSNISITIETDLSRYEVTFGYSSGRIEPLVGEKLESRVRSLALIHRMIGSENATFYISQTNQSVPWPLKEPEKPALTLYKSFQKDSPEADEIDTLLRIVHNFSSRGFDLRYLKRYGSESGYQTWLDYLCRSLWSVLRNLHDRKNVDSRYDTIVELMRECFPDFKDLLIEQTGPNSVYGSFLFKSLRQPVAASGVSDGHIQMLILLNALFSEEKRREPLLLLDEPESSLHPYALATLARAVKVAAEEWNRQIFIATHSPVLMSQFEPDQVFEVENKHGVGTVLRRVSEIDNVKDLLEEYPVGSLYMGEVLGPQSAEREATHE